MTQTGSIDFLSEYWTDAWQRSVLALDVLRERGNTYLERSTQNAPHVLTFKGELVLDGETLANIYLGAIKSWDDAADLLTQFEFKRGCNESAQQ